MVPSGATAGAMFRPGRCEPQACAGGTESGDGGHGKLRVLKLVRHLSPLAGALGVSDAKLAIAMESSAPIFTSHAPRTSVPQGLFCFESLAIASRITL